MPASTPPESFAFRVGRLLAQDGGGQLNDVVKQSNDLQEDGFHFRVRVVPF